MDEDMQALFMQARIVRLANLRWGIPPCGHGQTSHGVGGA